MTTAGFLLITYLGTASFIFDFGFTRVLTDPGDFLTERLSPEKAREISGIDLILLSHGHFDHSNRLTDIPGARGIPVLAPESVKFLFPGFDLRTEASFDFRGLRIRAIRSTHGVSHWEDHRSYLIENEGFRIFFLGDAYAIDPEEAVLASMPDLLFVTLGVFETNAESAFRNIEALKPKKVIPMHWERYWRSDESVREFAKKLVELFPSVECVVPEIGGTIVIGER